MIMIMKCFSRFRFRWSTSNKQTRQLTQRMKMALLIKRTSKTVENCGIKVHINEVPLPAFALGKHCGIIV